MTSRRPHRQFCGLCHEVVRVGFHVPDDVWALATHISQRETIHCLRCFTRIADERGVAWGEGITFYPTDLLTHMKGLRGESEAT